VDRLGFGHVKYNKFNTTNKFSNSVELNFTARRNGVPNLLQVYLKMLRKNGRKNCLRSRMSELRKRNKTPYVYLVLSLVGNGTNT